MELVEELEAAAAPSPSDALLELAGLRTATRLAQLTYQCDRGRVIVSEYVALKNQHDDAADVCRICHGPGTVRPADADDETGARLLRDTCLCRGSIGCVHEECLVRWYESVDFPVEPRCPTCRGPIPQRGWTSCCRDAWRTTRRFSTPRHFYLHTGTASRLVAKRTTPETPTDLARRRHAEITRGDAAVSLAPLRLQGRQAFETALDEIRRSHGGDEATLRGDIARDRDAKFGPRRACHGTP